MKAEEFNDCYESKNNKSLLETEDSAKSHLNIKKSRENDNSFENDNIQNWWTCKDLYMTSSNIKILSK